MPAEEGRFPLRIQISVRRLGLPFKIHVAQYTIIIFLHITSSPNLNGVCVVVRDRQYSTFGLLNDNRSQKS